MAREPVKVLKEKLIALGVPKTEIEKIEKVNEAQVEKDIQLAKKAPFPDVKELFEHVYAN